MFFDIGYFLLFFFFCYNSIFPSIQSNYQYWQYQQMQLPSLTKTTLPNIQQQQTLRQQVTRLIKNKIQPLSFKQYVLKSGRYQKKAQPENISLTLNKTIEQSRQKQRRKTIYKERTEADKGTINTKTRPRRRKAFVEISNFVLDKKSLQELQAKVERHIVLKKMDLMENQYAYAEECNQKMKEQVIHKLSTSPLQKYLFIFQQNQKPSEKIKRVEQATCQQMLKQIKSAKSIKHVECIEQNMKNLYNTNTNTGGLLSINTHSATSSVSAVQHLLGQPHSQSSLRLELQAQPETKKKIKKQGTDIAYTEQTVRRHNNKLRKQIMNDIKKQYENQGGATKIRISINHKKMIQLP